MERTEQKNVSWIRYPVRKLSRGGGFVLSLFDDTRYSAKAYRLLDQRRKFVGCIVNPEMLSAAKPSLVVTFVSQVLNWKLNTSGRGEDQAAVKVSADKMGALRLKRKQLCGKFRLK